MTGQSMSPASRSVGPPSGSSDQPRSRSIATGRSTLAGAHCHSACISDASKTVPARFSLNHNSPASVGTLASSDQGRCRVTSIGPAAADGSTDLIHCSYTGHMVSTADREMPSSFVAPIFATECAPIWEDDRG